MPQAYERLRQEGAREETPVVFLNNLLYVLLLLLYYIYYNIRLSERGS